MNKKETLLAENKKLEIAFKEVEAEKQKLVKDAEETLKQLSQKQAQINVSIIKNQGKLELLSETDDKLKEVDKEVTPKK